MPRFDYSIKKQQNSKSSAVIICRDNKDLNGEAEARIPLKINIYISSQPAFYEKLILQDDNFAKQFFIE